MATAKLFVIMWACLVYGQPVLGQDGHDRFFDTNGVKIRYQIWGKGTRVVLIHGFGETLESWTQAGVIRVLSPHFQVIAMDVRGHGRSSKPDDEKSYGQALSADVLQLIRHISTAKAHIVGYSMGANVALDFAVHYQKHVLSVVLGGAGWNPPETLEEFRQLAGAFEQGRVPVRDGDNPKAMAALLRSLRILSEEEVRGIRVPIAAVIGSKDRFMPNVHRLSRVLPGTHVVVIPEVNHESALSDPKFAEALLAFLRKTESEYR